MGWRKNKLFPRMRLLKLLIMGIVLELRIKQRLMTHHQDHTPSVQLTLKSEIRIAENFFWSISQVRSVLPIVNRIIEREDLRELKLTSLYWL